MLRSDIRQFVCRSSCKRQQDMTVTAREREFDLEMERKRRSDEAQVSAISSKRPKVFDVRKKGEQGRGHCGKCDRMHDRAVGGSDCF